MCRVCRLDGRGGRIQQANGREWPAPATERQILPLSASRRHFSSRTLGSSNVLELSDVSRADGASETRLPHLRGRAPSGAGRVARGGSYWDQARNVRSAYRNHRDPGNEIRNQGFRVCLPRVPEPAAEPGELQGPEQARSRRWTLVRPRVCLPFW